jgi:hypothetical protein
MVGPRYYTPNVMEDGMGRKKKVKAPLVVVLGRSYSVGFWDGQGWVEDHKKAVQYNWRAKQDRDRAVEDRDHLRSARHFCELFFIPPSAEGEQVKPKRLGDVFVLCRSGVFDAGTGIFWDGDKWVADFLLAEQYLGAPTDDLDRAERDRDRLRAAGTPCGILYFPPPRARRR